MHQISLLSKGDGGGRQRLVDSLDDPDASSSHQRGDLGLAHHLGVRGTSEDQVAGDVEDGRRIIEPRRGRGDDVPTNPRASLQLDLRHRLELGKVKACEGS